MNDGKSNVYPFKKRPKHRRRLNHLTAIVKRKRSFTAIPDPLDRAYRMGKINDTLFRLIYILLGSDEDFLITREYLESQFSAHTLKKYLPLIEKAKIVEIEKIVLTEGAKPSNIYHTTDPDDWDMSPILKAPRRGCNTARMQGTPSTARMQGSRRKKSSDISNTARMQGTPKKPNDIHKPLPAYVQDIRKGFKTPPQKLLNITTLQSRFRFRFNPKTPSDHIKATVNALVEAEEKRLLLKGFDERTAKVLSRERVYRCIEWITPCKHREFGADTQAEWLRMLENFPQE
ncbi:MAG TPA: hypothetical protein VE954_43150 [Oligoflexus sp.]|uniref:hypothetical protein n=1 Tax=Oligoflexus sp. TaxID=1971216 RepID=UPI002D53B8B1|nr:hypothetical protein [Oligoflexus sp.]HYX39942.1 hypothetical protein [Oligoflexus sp.]